jgi:Fe-S cluster biogenesis protein NfuA
MTDRSLDQQMRRVEELVETLEKRSDPVVRASAQELMQTLLALHRNGLARLLEIVRQTENGPAIAAALGQDNVISSLLLLHGLHPVELATRANQALDQVRPFLRGHGGDLEIVAITARVVRVRLIGECSLSTEALEHFLEEAFVAVAPDVQVIEVEDPSRGIQTRLPLPML